MTPSKGIRYFLILLFAARAGAVDIEPPKRCGCVQINATTVGLSWDYNGEKPHFFTKAAKVASQKDCEALGEEYNKQQTDSRQWCGKPIWIPEAAVNCRKPQMISLDFVRNEFTSGYPEEAPNVQKAYSITAGPVTPCKSAAAATAIEKAIARVKIACGRCTGLTVVANSHGLPVDKTLKIHKVVCAHDKDFPTSDLFTELQKQLAANKCTDTVMVLDACHSQAAADAFPPSFPGVFVPVSPADCAAPGFDSNFSTRLPDICAKCKPANKAHVSVEDYEACLKKYPACGVTEPFKHPVDLPDGTNLPGKCYKGWPPTVKRATIAGVAPLFHCDPVAGQDGAPTKDH